MSLMPRTLSASATDVPKAPIVPEILIKALADYRTGDDLGKSRALPQLIEWYDFFSRICDPSSVYLDTLLRSQDIAEAAQRRWQARAAFWQNHNSLVYVAKSADDYRSLIDAEKEKSETSRRPHIQQLARFVHDCTPGTLTSSFVPALLALLVNEYAQNGLEGQSPYDVFAKRIFTSKGILLESHENGIIPPYSGGSSRPYSYLSELKVLNDFIKSEASAGHNMVFTQSKDPVLPEAVQQHVEILHMHDLLSQMYQTQLAADITRLLPDYRKPKLPDFVLLGRPKL